jgi:sulfur-carrier protein
VDPSAIAAPAPASIPQSPGPIPGTDSITVVVKLFAAYQDAYGQPELRLTLPLGTTVGELGDRLISQKPQLARWREVTRFGVNLEFAAADTLLQEADEVVLIPPVSGG